MSPPLRVNIPRGLDPSSPVFLAGLASASIDAARAGEEDEVEPGYETDVCSDRAGCPRGCERAVARVAVLVVVLFIAFEAHACLVLGFPNLRLDPVSHSLAIALLAAVVFWIYAEYLLTMWTDPGQPQAAALVPGAATAPEPAPLPEAAAPAAEVPASGQTRQPERGWCSRCNGPKPPRCHHCRACGRCVLRMDHHCVFTNSCIGQRNYGHFLRFLVASVFGLSLPCLALLPQVFDMALMLAPAFLTIFGAGVGSTVHAVLPAAVLEDFGPGWLSPRFEEDLISADLYHVHVLIAWLTGTIVLVLNFNLLVFHMDLLCRNETTLESLENWLERRRSAYDRGLLANYSEVCGSQPECCSNQCCEALLRCLQWFVSGGRE